MCKIKAVGAFLPEDTDKVAYGLYQEGFYQNETTLISLMCIGRNENVEKKQQFPSVPQITFDHILDLIFDRLTRFKHQKAHHPQWPSIWKALFGRANGAIDVNEFKSCVHVRK